MTGKIQPEHDEHHRAPARVVICGGGVAALEAVLALREILAIRPHIDIVAPNREFVYMPMAVAEPFGLARTKLFDLAAIASDLGAELHSGSLQSIDGAERCIVLADGSRLSYDAAIVAVGARRREWLENAITFGGPDDVPAFEAVLERIERGQVVRLAFASPPGIGWTLPLYELALLTAARFAERGVSEAELAIVTPEADPLAPFGTAASRMLRDQLSDRGIRLHVQAAAERFDGARLQLSTGATLDVDEVVALPRLEGPWVAGLPADDDGFILVDEQCRVVGLPDVYAAGDGTNGSFKQGGLATQQADVAAECIAAGLGAPLTLPTFEPLLRGMLLTGVAPMYLRAKAPQAAGEDGEVAANALWWPPTKIAGRYLGPYLAFASTLEKHGPLEDRAARAGDPEAVEDSHREARELALVFAEADARGGDFRSALGWLEIIERLDGVLPTGYLDRRESWRERASGGIQGA